MIEKLTFQDVIDRIDQIREHSPKLFGHRFIKDSELADAVAHLRTTYPEQVRNACALLEQRDALLIEAKHQSSRIIEEGQRAHDDLIADSEITKTATVQKEQAMTEIAQERKAAEEQADAYSLKMLQQLEQILTRLTDTVKASEHEFLKEEPSDEPSSPEAEH